MCPAVGVPVGTGVINPGGNYNIWRDNWVYGNSYAGFVTTWVPGFVRDDNRFARPVRHLAPQPLLRQPRWASRPDGTTAPNGMDFWWDGQGVGSCWQDPSDAGAEPRVLPRCGADDLPAGLGTARYVAEPAKVLKLYVCSNYDLADAADPDGLRLVRRRAAWPGSRCKYALGEAILLGLRSDRAVVAAVARLRNGVPRSDSVGWPDWSSACYGTACGDDAAERRSAWRCSALGWLMLRGSPAPSRRPGLGLAHHGMGVLALLGAVDRGLYMLPWIPVPPSLWRIVLEASGCQRPSSQASVAA